MSTNAVTKPISVKIISDILCPWCYVGKRNLEEASRRSGIPVSVTWAPFYLDPSIPAEGRNLREHLTAKYGRDMAIRFTSPGNPLEQAGKGVGIAFALDRWVFNSTDCHRVMEWCNEHQKDRADGLMEQMFKACHEQGKDLANRDNLMAVVVAAGLGDYSADIAAMLASNDLKDAVARNVREAKDLYRVSGVPFFIIDNQNGGRPSAFSGAQPVDVIEEVLAECHKE